VSNQEPSEFEISSGVSVQQPSGLPALSCSNCVELSFQGCLRHLYFGPIICGTCDYILEEDGKTRTSIPLHARNPLSSISGLEYSRVRVRRYDDMI